MNNRDKKIREQARKFPEHQMWFQLDYRLRTVRRMIHKRLCKIRNAHRKANGK